MSRKELESGITEIIAYLAIPVIMAILFVVLGKFC